MALFRNRTKRIIYHIGGSCFLGVVLFLAALILCQQPGIVHADTANQVRVSRDVSSSDQSVVSHPAAASGTFTSAFLFDITGLDPALGQSDGGTASQVYETLVKYQTGGSIPIPGLAQSWTVSTNGLAWTFTLRPGVKFHDGTDLTASAVVSNFERWWDPANPYHVGDFWIFAWAFGGLKGDPGCLLQNVVATGPLQVQLVLSTPYNLLPSYLTMNAFSIASPAAIQAGTLSTMPVGTGSYQFTEWSPITRVRLSSYPSYWGGSTHIQTLIFQSYSGFDDLFTALKQNTVQAADIPMTHFPTATMDSHIKVVWNPPLSVGYLGMNRAHPALDNLLVRQAIAHAIDKQYLINHFYNTVSDMGKVASQFLPPDIWGYDNTIADYAYDPVLARSLLTQAGYTHGVTLSLWYMPVNRVYMPDPLGIAQKMQTDLREVGITTTLVTYAWGDYLGRIAAGEADLFMLGWNGDIAQPENYFAPNLCQSSMRYGPRDDVLCDQIIPARADMDFTSVLSTYQWASRRVHETLPLLPIGYPRYPLILRSNVAGVVPGSGAGLGSVSLKDVFYITSSVYLPIMRRL